MDRYQTMKVELSETYETLKHTVALDDDRVSDMIELKSEAYVSDWLDRIERALGI